MLQSDQFCRFTKTSVRRRATCASYFEGMPYIAGGIGRPISCVGGRDRERRGAGGGGDAADGERAARHGGALAEKRAPVLGLEPRVFLLGQQGSLR